MGAARISALEAVAKAAGDIMPDVWETFERDGAEIARCLWCYGEDAEYQPGERLNLLHEDSCAIGELEHAFELLDEHGK